MTMKIETQVVRSSGLHAFRAINMARERLSEAIIEWDDLEIPGTGSDELWDDYYEVDDALEAAMEAVLKATFKARGMCASG